MTSTLERPPPTQRRAISFGTWVSAVIAAHMALWGTVMAGGWLYRDDFILQAQAARLGLTTALLLNNHDGHLMPATHLVVWVVQELGGLDYALVAGTMLIGQIVLVASAVTAFTALLGRGMSTSSTDSNLCVESVRVGKVVPSDLPYGGGVYIADQLRGLQ